MTSPLISIVVPCFNEAECLATLHARLTAVGRSVASDDYEILLVNDGSRDDSWAMMEALAAEDPDGRAHV